MVFADRCFGCGSCVLACMASSRDGRGWAAVLELGSRSEERPIWIPYLCSQVTPDPPCGPSRAAPPCELACPTRAIQYVDLDSVGSRGAMELPASPGAPGARLVGALPGDVELPDARDVLPIGGEASRFRGGTPPFPWR